MQQSAGFFYIVCTAGVIDIIRDFGDYNSMEKKFLSRQYLESISTADLISLADDYGIDIPDNLNRRFIIGELLEVADEMENEKKSDGNALKQADVTVPDTLPQSYNETQICAILRNPAWAFVFWDIKESDLHMLHADSSVNSLFLHISFYETAEAKKSIDSFDIQISINDREQYVLIPGGKKFFTIDLAYTAHSEAQSVLASTKCIEIPVGNEALSNMRPGVEVKMSQVLKLSGMEKLLHDHYNNHRQSFS